MSWKRRENILQVAKVKPDGDVTKECWDASPNQSRMELVEVRSGCCNADPISNKGKFLQLCRILSLILIPLGIMSAMACYWLVNAVMQRNNLDDVKSQLEFGRRLGDAVFALQLERAQVVYATKEGNFSVMVEAFKYTDSKVANMDPKTAESTTCFNSTTHVPELIQQHRMAIKSSHSLNNVSTHDEVEFYSSVTSCWLSLLLTLAKEMAHGSLWQEYIGYKMMLKAQESVGLMLSLGIAFFEVGALPTVDYNLLRHHDVVSQELMQTAAMFSKETAILFSELKLKDPQIFGDMTQYRLDWQVNSYADYGNEKGREFHDQVMSYFTNIADIKNELGDIVLKKIDEEINVSISFMIFTCILVIFVVILTPVLVKLMYSMTTSIQNHAIVALEKSKQLIEERQRSDSLLYQMLPKPVAQQLRLNQEVPGEYYEQVTLYFSDIVGFTSISAKSSPLEVVDLLNNVYQLFDSLLDLYDVYKVETIGDAYMVVSGLPKRNGNQHVVEIGLMTIELLVAVKECSIPHLPGTPLELRVGIHTGSVVAGVVGNKMPRYCLFGDTVNTSSRMESHGLPSKIHISAATNDLLQEVKGFDTERRGLVDIKGKGQMETFWLTNTNRRLRSDRSHDHHRLLVDFSTPDSASPHNGHTPHLSVPRNSASLA